MINEIINLMKHELLLSVILFLLLIIKIGSNEENSARWHVMVNVLLLINLIAGFCCNVTGELFNGMFLSHDLIHLEKNILNLGLLIISLQSHPYTCNHHHAPEFYILLLSSVLGMFFMLSSGHLLLFYIGLELSTIPLAALANFNLNKSASSEAGMKMIMSSAFSSALLLMGISLMYGTTGSLSFSEITLQLTGSPLQVFAFVMLFVGFAFKLSIVPFHLWTADVYEGAPVSVAAFLSVISKSAIAFVFVTVLFSVFESMLNVWIILLFITAVITIGVGNLFALRQQNIKRFLAFSSIAQVGFILVGISGGTQESEAAVVYFLLIYIFSNLGAFGVVNIVSAMTGKESINDYKGFHKTNPALSWIMTISLFSLAGIPPTAGFFGKLFLLTAGSTYLLIGIAAINMVVSMYYYLRIVKAMFMDANEHPIQKISLSLFPGIALVICIVGILLTGFSGELYSYIHSLSIGI